MSTQFSRGNLKGRKNMAHSVQDRINNISRSIDAEPSLFHEQPTDYPMQKPGVFSRIVSGIRNVLKKIARGRS